MKYLPSVLAALGLLQLPSPARAADPTPEQVRATLTGYTWNYQGGKKRDATVRFQPDGNAIFTDDKNSTWTLEADRKVRIGDHITITLDSNLTTFTGFNRALKRKIDGQRLTPVAADGQPAPTPSVAPIADGQGTPPSLPAPSPSASPVAPAPAKNTLNSIAESGPAITDQVLAPLDLPSVPEATISLWKEDLLDEAAHAPASLQPSYRLAASLMDSWKSALRERYQIISTTGFSGGIIDTPDTSSSRKTTLHVWDWLQYSRERDDAARHEIAKQRTADFFASGPPRRWAERSAILRTNLERLYATFRQSLRASSQPTP
ncbi:hypothetical protein BH09VER1_BH09VER1_46190 [soil metagenome]